MENINITLIGVIAVALLQIADALLTIAIIQRGGREMNPLMRGLMRRIGRDRALLVLKLAFVALVIYARDAIPLYGLGVLIAGCAGVVAWNAHVLRGMRRA